MVGEGVLVINLEYSVGCSLGGSSKHFLWVGTVTMAVHGRGFPGSCSHRNGTEAEVWSGGVERPDGSGDSFGEAESKGSFGEELALDVITVCVCVCQVV